MRELFPRPALFFSILIISWGILWSPSLSVGGEGCTPGFWKQDQHFIYWTGYTPDDGFADVLGAEITIRWSAVGKPQPVYQPTLLQALQAEGGGMNALARHVVVALLNAASPEIDYSFSSEEIIEIFNEAIDDGDIEATKDLFEEANALCCPLDDQVVPDFSRVDAYPFENISEEGILNPVLTAADVDDLDDASFLADPFLFHDNDTWYMFFEVGKWNGSTHFGRIGLATSADGLNWTYDSIVLDEVTHHSYPLIIKYKCKYYMITESYRQRQIRFYQALDFPYQWERVYTITRCGDGDVVLPGQCIDTPNSSIGYLDPSIFRYEGKWWMFGGAGSNSYLYLYYSEDLFGGWTEHPLSPIVADDRSMARPGGRAFVFDEDRIIRLAQKCDVRYGQRVRAFEITTLDEFAYDEYEIAEGAPFCESGGVFCETDEADSCSRIIPCDEREDMWNLCGMHNLDAWWTGDRWLMVTDGYKCIGQTPDFTDDWAIGIFVSDPF